MDLSSASAKQLEPGQEVYTFGGILEYAAETYPRKTGVICGDFEMSFAGMDKAANRFAHLVRERTGPRDTVAFFMRNSAEYTIAHFGVARTGQVAVHLSPRFSAEELVYTLNKTRPALLIADEKTLPAYREIEKRLDRRPALIAIDALEGVERFWDSLDGRPESPPGIDIRAEDEAAIIFTGGTTGKPKGARVTQRGRAISAITAVEDFRIEPDQICAITTPLCHTAGLFTWYQPTVLAGCTGVVLEKWDVPKFQAACAEHGISAVFAVPAQLALLFDHPDFDPDKLKSLRFMTFGGAPLSRDLIERAAELLPWVSIQRAYGSTEMGHMMAQIESDRDILYEGWNQPGGRLDIEVFEAPGKPADYDEVGEIATRGAHVMLGYLNNDEANEEFFKSGDEWGWTGDLGIKHKEGYITLAGRAKDMILSGGMNVFPAEIEDALIEHPAVAEAAAFAISDPTWGELPAAAVVPEQGETPEEAELLDFAAKKVARYKRPRRIVFVDEIPRTGIGKIRRQILIERFGDLEPVAAAKEGEGTDEDEEVVS